MSVFKALSTIITTCYLVFCVALVGWADIVKFGDWSEARLTQLISARHGMDDPGRSIVALSTPFVGTPYAEHTLLGGPGKPEQLVVNLAEFDCLTFLDVIEALRRSAAWTDFTEQLTTVRYADSIVSYARRRHFFSDWVVDDALVEDVTRAVGNGKALTSRKQLNLKADGSLWLPGIAVTSRQIHYIPAAKVDEAVLSALQPGDYVGIYSDLAGIDVSHTGLIVVDQGRVLLRHASSRSDTGRILDEELFNYLSGKVGLVIYRAKP